MSASHSSEPKEKFFSKSVEPRHFDKTLVAAFERAAAMFPARVALGSDVWQPTYRELNEAANSLAHRLITFGSVLGGRAAILMAHDAPMVAGVIGILKTGQIVVPLNPDDPAPRLKTVLEDAEPSIIVTDRKNFKLATEFAQLGCRIVAFESEAGMGPLDNPSIKILPEQNAFLSYTSGTTGRPKAVMNAHRQLLRGAAVHIEALRCTENDRIPLFALISTGQGATGLWLLQTGAMLFPFPLRARGVSGLDRWIVERGLTVYASSASIFRTLVKTIDENLVFANVRAVRLASEAVTAEDFKAFQKHFPTTSILVHGLSSSETSNIAWSRWGHSDTVPEGVLPVGHFSRDVLILGDNSEAVARGEVGEIVVRSRYVANGYWRDAELTARRFSADVDGTGTRLVRTGDLGRINADGLLEFRGRKDDRIKVRGNRIELGEIERTLEKLPGIDGAAVIAVQRENHEALLTAFVVKTPTASWTAQRLRHAARANLPLHMVPSKIVFLDRFPFNRGNKIDREALRANAHPIRDACRGAELWTETELLLANMWADILELRDISLNDDFFNLGGDSLRGSLVAAQVQAAFGVELGLGAIADHSTVSTLAAFIDACRQMGVPKTPPIVRTPRTAPMPMSFSQEAMWNYCRGPQAVYLHTNRVTGPLDVEVFKECLSYLIDRHEILRTTFALVDGRPRQIIHASAPHGFEYIDLIDAQDPEEQADSLFRKASIREVELTKLPIKRELLVRVAAENYRLLRISHVMITDGFTSRILEAEFAALYEARMQGNEPPLPREAPLQYADYAVWQRQVLQSESPISKEAVTWWNNVLSSPPPAKRLPFRRLIPRVGLDSIEGVLNWQLEEKVATQLDQIARNAGATYFIVRLAAFIALLADVTDNSTVAIGTYLDNRNSVDAQTIAGRFLTTATLVFSYDASKTFLDWVKSIRERVFETIERNEPAIHEQLRASGVKLPEFQVVFMMSSNHADQHFGGLTVTDEIWTDGAMPQGCTVYVDEQKPQNCRAIFDAGRYDKKGMRAMLDRYLQLLEVASSEPELPIGTILSRTGTKSVLWTWANYAAPFYEFVRGYYVGLGTWKMLWKPINK